MTVVDGADADVHAACLDALDRLAGLLLVARQPGRLVWIDDVDQLVVRAALPVQAGLAVPTFIDLHEKSVVTTTTPGKERR